MSAKDLYSRENIIAAIDLVGAGMTAAEKRAVLERMTADVERLAAEAKEFGVRDEDVSWRCCGQWWGLARKHCPVCGAPCHASGPTERERAEMCGPDPVRNSDLGL